MQVQKYLISNGWVALNNPFPVLKCGKNKNPEMPKSRKLFTLSLAPVFK